MAFILSCAGGDDVIGPSKDAPPALLNQTLPDTTQPWVRTNKDDYIPDEMVLMFGGRFQPGEQVRLTLSESPELHDDREYTVTADSIGNFRFDGFRPEEHHIGVSFVLTALGLNSGSQAQTPFTDAIVFGDHTINNNGDPFTSELTLQKPSTVASGTFMIAQIVVQGLNTSDHICPPTGWTTVLRTNNSSSVVLHTFRRMAGGAEPTSYTWTLRASTCGGSAVELGIVGGIMAYTGVDVTDPIADSAGNFSSSTTRISPILAGAAANSRVIHYYGNDKEFEITTHSTGATRVYEERRDKAGGGFEKPSGAASHGNQAAAGSTVADTAKNNNNGGNWVAQTIVLREAVAQPTISINDVTANEGNSGTTNFTFTITRSAATAQSSSVNWATANGTTNPATGAAACGAGVDYKSNSGTATIAANQTTTTVVIEVCGDLLNELNETFFVNLSNPTNATIADGQGLGTITNDDAAPSISINDVTQLENSPNFTFTVSLSAASAQQVTVNFATANGTTDPATGGASCVAGVDYVTHSGTVTLIAGETSKPVTVIACNDALDEANETFFVNLSSPTNATISDGQGLGTITDDDASPSLSINNVTQSEGTGGTTNFTFTVTLSAASAQTVAVDFATADGTTNPATGGAACPGADYVTQSGTRTFTAGDVSEDITVVVCADAVDEANETFFVNLSNASNATISDGQGLGTINDDDAAPSLSINDVTLAEGTVGTTNFTFTVSLSAASGQTVTVDFATANGTSNPATGGAACPGADYVTQNGTRTFVPGDQSETITVVVCADAIDELNETFFVNLSNASNATTSDAQGLGTITDDDAPPTVSINDVTQNEGTGGTTNFTFTVSLSAASSQTITVDYGTAPGTATAGACPGADYTTASGNVTFTPSDVSETVTVSVCPDAVDEVDETFLVNLSNADNATIGDGQGIGTITDDDAAPSLSIDGVTQIEGTGGTTSFTFTVSLSAASSQTVTVDFATANGTTNPATGGAACPGADYITQNGTRTFVPGDVSETITVLVCADALDEANETFFVNLSNESNATISDPQGLGTITDDDAAPALSINDVTVVEGTGGTTNFTFTVSLSAASGQTVTVDFATANGTSNPATGGAACPGADYVTQTGTRTFLPGDQSESITVVVCADAIDELNETFFVSLSNAGNATITDAQGVGTITDDDLPADQVGPVTSEVTANPNPVKMNTSFELSAKVDDSNTGNSNIASAEYSLNGGAWISAGATATPAFNTSPTVTVKWTVPGRTTDVYSVCVKGTDAAGNTGDPSCILLAVYDPTAGFVTGGGWINSPVGAYVSNPTLTGRANFGFVSKYKKGATVPDGSTEFQFQAAGLNFHSTVYEWLVVAGPRAQFKGAGRLNGVDGYGFLLTAIDGTTDQFRIKITNSAGVVVYDNQPSEPETGSAATPLGGGNIVIHRP